MDGSAHAWLPSCFGQQGTDEGAAEEMPLRQEGNEGLLEALVIPWGRSCTIGGSGPACLVPLRMGAWSYGGCRCLVWPSRRASGAPCGGCPLERTMPIR